MKKGIPSRGSIPPRERRHGNSAQRRGPSPRSLEERTRRANAPGTGRAWPIKAWTFQEKPTFKRWHALLRVRRLHQPEVDVDQQPAQLVVIADLSGIEREDVDVDVHGDIVAIEATRLDSFGQVHHYRGEVLLPVEVNETSADMTFKGGLLEIRLKPKTEVHETAETDDERNGE